MRLLLDTNIPARLVNTGSPGHNEATDLIRTLSRSGHEMVVVPQCVYELWSVMTRPVGAPNGMGFSPERARSAVDDLSGWLTFLPDTPAIYDRWLELVSRFGVSGRPSHDARLAAAVLAHGLDGILTLNAPDFKRFSVNVLTPADFAPGGPPS
ncbi:type II toxin-antitoxin system VapC family toxin [Deinococcus koreensis]|uniref:type II toxin-antitoxin system VapC family toxin n=1 Tax=Deinococcus koreensis TaxID=2054903 RepID=UPI001057260B|nr:type II toxin-antitoxin system VapC family toxin [Deinococcus koreensis]